MEKPQTLQAAVEALDVLEKELSVKEADLVAAQQLIEQGADLQDQVNSLKAKLIDQENLIQSLNQKNAALAEAASLNEMKLNEAIAAAGVPPVAIQQKESIASKEQLWAEYKTLSVYDKHAFWQKHKSVLVS